MRKITDERDSEGMELESGWVPESQAIYNSLLKRKDAGELKLMVETSNVIKMITREGRLLFPTSGLEDLNKMYNSVLFYDEKEKKAYGLCQFGPYAQGPVGYAHGGAIATMADVITSHVCMFILHNCMTRYLTINYKRGIPLNCPVLLEVWCVKTEGRKVWIDYKMMNAKDKTVYADGESLWLHLKSVL
ncbi:acyl-coenzyme A thioesterase THEM4-like [Amphiura filiformis]|uniref:acyl-coenzyme A thioesterase THEM4-like n=1 Tax=Amphiura filiformis TaxID=82378 RepID=UPI003B212AD1